MPNENTSAVDLTAAAKGVEGEREEAVISWSNEAALGYLGHGELRGSWGG